MMTALIDGDTLIYRAGFAAQRNIYRIELYSDPEATEESFEGVIKHDFNNKTEATKWIKDHTDDPGFKDLTMIIDWDLQLSPVSHAFSNAKQLIHSIMENTQSDRYRIVMGNESGTSFRKNLTNSYKANRDPAGKPFYLDELRHYLKTHHGAEYAPELIETDDVLGIEQTQSMSSTVICTIDKDLRMIPGWYYHFKDVKMDWINELDGMLHFYTQLLTGDNADNIRGIYRMGEKTAKKLLKNCAMREEMEEIVTEKYLDHFGEGGLPLLELNKQLLWIMRDYSEVAKYVNVQ